MAILSKLEIDVMQANELMEAAELAYKHALPAIIVHPGLAAEGHIARSKVRGRFKLITPVGWFRNNLYSMQKLQGLDVDALETDGFEIMLSSDKTEAAIKKEAFEISRFINGHVSPAAEIRFVLNTSVNENIVDMLNGLSGIPTPACIRNDTKTKTQVNKANQQVYQQLIQQIRGIIRAPIKISGNITDIRIMANCQEAAKFGVNLLQAKAIIREFNKQQPDVLRQLLDTKSINEDQTGDTVEVEEHKR